MSDLALRRRFDAWRVVVVGTVIADAVVAWRGSHAATIVAIASLAAMLALLVTTPANAVVLARGRSERVLLIGAIALYAVAAWRGGSAILATVAIVVDVILLRACRRGGASAWWTALVAWQPAILLAIREAR